MSTYEITITTGNPNNPYNKIYVDADLYEKNYRKNEYQFKLNRKVIFRVEMPKVLTITVKKKS